MSRLKTDRLGIVIEPYPYDRGYFARFNNQPRPEARLYREGWDDCNDELAFERKQRRSALSEKPDAS